MFTLICFTHTSCQSQGAGNLAQLGESVGELVAKTEELSKRADEISAKKDAQLEKLKAEALEVSIRNIRAEHEVATVALIERYEAIINEKVEEVFAYRSQHLS